MKRIYNYPLRLSLLLSLLTAATLVSAQKQVLFVVGNPTLNSSDSAVNAIMTGELGYSVTVIDDDVATAADANGKDLVLISSTVSGNTVGATFANTSTPVLLYEKDLQDDMGMVASGSGQKGSTTTSGVDIADATHPLAGDLGGMVYVFNNSQIVNWGVPNGNATIIAQKINSTNVLYYAYESGAVMPGQTAPARRVFNFLHDNSAQDLTARGKQLFKASIQWTAGETLNYPSSQERALLVVEKASLEIGADSVLMEILQDDMGYNVIIEDENNITTADGDAVDLIYISSTVMSTKIGDHVLPIPVPPIINFRGPKLLDDLGMVFS